MTVHVKLLGEFGDNLQRDHSLTSEELMTVDQILDILRIERTEVSMIVVGGKMYKNGQDVPLADGDAVSLLPCLEEG